MRTFLSQGRRRHSIALVLGVAVLGALGWSSLITPGGATQPSVLGHWAPGINAQVTAMARLPQPHNPPPALLSDIQHVSDVLGGESVSAKASLKELRSNLGNQRESLYAFSPNDGGLCVVYWPRGAACPTASGSPTPGVILKLSPGGPGYPGEPANTPAAIAGIADDSVAGIVVDKDGMSTAVPIINNAFFFDLGALPSEGRPWNVSLTVQYSDGGQRSVAFLDPRSDG